MHNNVNNIMGTANPSGIIWQPVAMPPANTSNYNIGKKSAAIRTFSIIGIVLGVLSIFIQIATLVIYATSIFYYVYYPLDVIGHGIWCGAFYLTAGSLGLAACRKGTKSLLIATVVMSSISIAGAIVASTLSGITAGYGFFYVCYYTLCDAWLGLEWTLMSISILAFVNAIILVSFASVPLCCGGPQGNTNIGVGSYQQPMYYQPQPTMYLAAQQQPDVHHFANAGQQNQYPQQAQYPQQQQFQLLQPHSEFTNAPQQQKQPTRHSLLLQRQFSQQKKQELPRLPTATTKISRPNSQSEQLTTELHTNEN
ncbi:hypothetical protein GHT06_013795 [Daphnia sinensis]|uniref:Uncharacterized protein n=1 Tax=Daphnia sinensis TaxID=1820382 RepID=A0AAD5LL43_9CRUS|nr:hypothetical protein GHT06_013795 [Daphnia sinensis]